MPIGYFRSVPKVDIRFEKDSYRPGDELRTKVTVHTDRPGLSVRRAVVDLVLENRYTHTSMTSTIDTRAFGSFAATGTQGNPIGRLPPVARTQERVTEERVDRVIIGQERLFTDGVIRHRTEIFDLRFEIKPPVLQRTTQRRLKYLISVHFDLPRMRDVEMHRVVPVDLG